MRSRRPARAKPPSPRTALAKLPAARQALADRVADLAAYDRVIADMLASEILSPFSGGQAIALVRVCCAAAAADIPRLQTTVTQLEKVLPP